MLSTVILLEMPLLKVYGMTVISNLNIPVVYSDICVNVKSN